MDGSRTLAFVGSWTSHPDARDGGVRVFEVGRDGSLIQVDEAAPELSAGYLAMSPDGRSLYAVDERRDSPRSGHAGGGVASFEVDAASGGLRLVRVSPTCAALPCHLSVSPSGDLVAIANHGSYEFVVTVAAGDGRFEARRTFDAGAVTLFAVRDDGSLGEASDVAVLPGRDPGTRTPIMRDPSGQFTGESQASSHPHAAVFHPTAPFLVVPDKGTDSVHVMEVVADAPALRARHRWQARPGSGARHAAPHPSLPVLYVLDELTPTLTVLGWDGATGALHQLQTLATIPAAADGVIWPAEVRVHPSGRSVFVSNRGHDSIASFPVRQDGTLDQARVIDCAGRTPRAFGIDPDGTWLFVLNQGSGTVVTFAIDADGRPSPTDRIAAVERPVSIVLASYLP